MGMYTEIYVNVNLKKDVPADVLAILHAMCLKDNEAGVLKDLPRRWSYMFNNGSYYTPGTECGKLTQDKHNGQWSLLAKGDIKNYENEIEQFFKWLMPWIDATDGEFVGYSRYEEDDLPRLVIKTESRPAHE